MDYLRAGISKHVDSKDLMEPGPYNDLAYSISPLVLSHETAGISHRKLDDLVVDAFRLGLGLSETRPGDFRIRLDNPGNSVVAHPVLFSEDIVDSDLTFP